MNTTKLIDYKQFATVEWLVWTLRELGIVPFCWSGLQGRCRCPFDPHKGTYRFTFAVDCRKGGWFCHGCKFGGNALTLYRAVRKISLYAAAKEMCEKKREEVRYLK